jgi:hypothetical protein
MLLHVLTKSTNNHHAMPAPLDVDIKWWASETGNFIDLTRGDDAG